MKKISKAIVKKAIAWFPRVAVTASLVSLILISIGTSLAQTHPQWYYDFVKERTQAWGDNISGWWFDGCYDNCPSSDAPKKFWDSTTAVNNKLAISFNSGIGIPKSFRSRSGYDHYTPGEMNRLFGQSDFDGFSGGAIARADGKKIQWHGWTYVTHHDPFNPPGWGG